MGVAIEQAPTCNKISVAETTFYRNNTPANEQDKILKLLENKLAMKKKFVKLAETYNTQRF